MTRQEYDMSYEIHITVGIDNIDRFKCDCKMIGVKPILLDLQSVDGLIVMNDVMTSSKVYGNDDDAFTEMKRISTQLKVLGYNVIREKIEAAYYHENAPFECKGNAMPNDCYFECHFNVLCNDELVELLSKLALENECHLSKNCFKKFENGSFTLMLTYRNFEQVYEDFKNHIVNVKDSLISNGFYVENEIIEFSIYDTKLEHDEKWLLGENND